MQGRTQREGQALNSVIGPCCCLEYVNAKKAERIGFYVDKGGSRDNGNYSSQTGFRAILLSSTCDDMV